MKSNQWMEWKYGPAKQQTNQSSTKTKLFWFVVLIDGCVALVAAPQFSLRIEFSSAIKQIKRVGYGPEAPLPHNHSAAKKTFLFRYGLFAPSSFFIKEKTSGGVG